MMNLSRALNALVGMLWSAAMAACALPAGPHEPAPSAPSTPPAPRPPMPPMPPPMQKAEPPLAQLPTPAPRAEKVSVGADVYFEPARSTLTAAAQLRLRELAAHVKSLYLEILVVVGHSDASGTAPQQMSLSQARAEAVTAFLKAQGVDANRIYTEAKGAAQPVASNDTAEGRARNNRVEVEGVGTRVGGAADARAWRPNDQVPVLFATNREPTGSERPMQFYGNRLIDRPDRDNLRYGIAVVRVPPERERGEVSRPGWVAVTLERVTALPAAKAVGIKPRPAADPRTEFSFAQPIRELDAAAFQHSLRSAVAASMSKTAVLYVHGYANDFADAAFRTAQIVFDLARPGYDVVPMMFSWPSDPGRTGMDYDEARRRSEASGYDLAHWLDQIATATEIGTVHLIAHSMGAEVLGHALLKLGALKLARSPQGQGAQPAFRQIVFAAPDVTPRIFEDVIEPAITTRHVITTYGASKDLALWLSTLKNRRKPEGLVGVNPRVAGCTDTVDVTAVAAAGLAHSTWAESPRVLDDLRQLLRFGSPPAVRGLLERTGAQAPVWALPKAVGTLAATLPAAAAVQRIACDKP